MCGIGGYASTTETVDPRLSMTLALLGVFMEDRGRQSWGYSDGERIIKRVGSFRGGGGPGLFGSPSAFIHTRQATTGDKTAENSHPFDIKGIIGCHNGMIYNHKAAAEKHSLEYKVDSELIFHLLADGTPLTELEGYGAIVFYQNGKLHLGRFSNRGDMHIAKTDAGWVFASTKTAIEDATGISGIKTNEWLEPDLGKLYQIDGDQLVVMPTELKISDMKVTQGGAYTSWQDFRHGGCEGYQAGQGTFYGGGYTSYNHGGHWDSNLKKWINHPALPLPTPETTTFTAEPQTDADEVIDVTDGASDDAYMAAAKALSQNDRIQTGMFSPEDFNLTTPKEHLGRDGAHCDECREHIDGDEPLYVEIYSETYICADCYGESFGTLEYGDLDTPPDVTLGSDFTKQVIAEMTRNNLSGYEGYAN